MLRPIAAGDAKKHRLFVCLCFFLMFIQAMHMYMGIVSRLSSLSVCPSVRLSVCLSVYLLLIIESSAGITIRKYRADTTHNWIHIFKMVHLFQSPFKKIRRKE